MSQSTEPPSQAGPPISGGSTSYVIGALVLAAAVGAMLYSRCSGGDTATAPTAPVTSTVKPPPPASPPPEFAPPPPPEETASAEPSASATRPSTAPKKSSATKGSGACSKCNDGKASAALKSAVRQTANMARGCYNKALRGGGGEGTLMVSVRVGKGGASCGVSVSGSVGNPGLKQCVLSKFRARSYPAPAEGCVTINVPIAFHATQ